MKILLIGGTSSIGRALKTELSLSHQVVTAGRNCSDIHIDLDDISKEIIFPSGVNTVVHTAAHFGGKSGEEIITAEKINVLGTLRLCQAAVAVKAKHFILISSIYAAMEENVVQHGIYALSKRHAEEAAILFCSVHSLPLTILRPSQIYGSEDNYRKHQPFFYMMMDKAERGENILLYGSRAPLRNYIHIDDLINIIIKVIDDRPEGVYSCTAVEDVSYVQIAEAAFAAFKKGGMVKFLKDKPDIPDNIFTKNDLLYKKISFYPRVSIEEGIKGIAKSRGIDYE